MGNLNEQQFAGYSLRYEPAAYPDPHRIKALDPEGTPVATLAWDSKQIKNVEVDSAHQGKGLATAMWDMGQEIKPRPKHSRDRTDAGDAWAKKVGGPLPRRLKT
jgi:ribosomal protein S18 acetylase RimI-like enzyme